MGKFLNISEDTTLGGNSPSDMVVSSQKAVKAYVDSQTGTAPAFANITGQPTDNTNLATALNAKQDTLVSGTSIKTVGGASLLGSGNIALPTKVSDLTNDSGFITTSALSGYQTTSNLVTSVSSSSTDSQYPSAKWAYDTLGDIETLLQGLR